MSGGKIAALYVEKDGAYFGLPGVDPWDEARDARLYAGPWPVVAHPPCQRWGRYSESHPIVGKIAETGDDGGCFDAALAAVRAFGGVIEHPKDSKAFVGPQSFNIGRPSPLGWTRSWDGIGWGKPFPKPRDERQIDMFAPMCSDCLARRSEASPHV